MPDIFLRSTTFFKRSTTFFKRSTTSHNLKGSLSSSIRIFKKLWTTSARNGVVVVVVGLLSSRPEPGSRRRRRGRRDRSRGGRREGEKSSSFTKRHDTHRVLADFNVQTTRGGTLFFVAALFLVAVFAVIFRGGDSTIAESEVREQNADGGIRTQRRLLAEIFVQR